MSNQLSSLEIRNNKDYKEFSPFLEEWFAKRAGKKEGVRL